MKQSLLVAFVFCLPLVSVTKAFSAQRKPIFSQVIVFQDQDVPYFEVQRQKHQLEVKIVRQDQPQKPAVIDSQSKESSILSR